jgi:acetolactate synthase regulatory subunit
MAMGEKEPSMTAISIAPTSLLGRERRLEIETTGDPDVLLRVMVVLRRRGFLVRAVEFRAGDLHAPPRLHMTVAPRTRLDHQLAAWLGNVVGVVSVEEG